MFHSPIDPAPQYSSFRNQHLHSFVFLKVVEVAWNIDSTVLAVWAEEMSSQDLAKPQEFVPKSYGK